VRSRAKARVRARSYPLRSRTNSSSLAASRPLIELPSSAASIRASRKTSASSFNVMFVFMVSTQIRAALFYVLNGRPSIPYVHGEWSYGQRYSRKAFVPYTSSSAPRLSNISTAPIPHFCFLVSAF